MKRKNTLITMYVITFLLSIISILAYQKRSSDFFSGLSSLCSDITIIVSFVIVTYSLIVCVIYMKDKLVKKAKHYDSNMIFSLLILLLSMLIVFISYASVFSHKNAIEFTIDTIIRGNNFDIVKLFIKSMIFYYFIYLCTIGGIVLNHRFNKNDNILYVVLAVFLLIIGIFLLIKFARGDLILIILILDIAMYFIIKLCWGIYEKRRKR